MSDIINVTISEIEPIAVNITDVEPIAVSISEGPAILDLDQQAALSGATNPSAINHYATLSDIAAASGMLDQPTYDPSSIASNVFDMDNMVEGATNLILTGIERTQIGNTSGVNTGDQTLPENLSDLNEDATHRTVTDTEKSTWNSKADALTADQNYVSDSELTVLQNTSNTNTGDQDLSGKQDNISLTTTGSGAATFIANTLNIPTPETAITSGEVIALVIALG